MKLNYPTKDVKTNKNVEREVIDFKVGDSKIVADLLRKHYKNPIKTMVQEYMSNARDAHREANNKNPIKVYIPTKVSKSIKIRDYGAGLTEDQVKNIFTTYGVSTKRKTNSQTGGFGIGSKSGWVYRDNFFINNYCNGVLTSYEATTAQAYEGSLIKIRQVKTNEPNGLEIIIPIKSGDEKKVTKAVIDTSMFWKTKPEIVGLRKEELPAFYYDSDPLVSGESYSCYSKDSDLAEYYNKKRAFAVIDGITYELVKDEISDNDIFSELGPASFFIEFNNGEVDIAISRESLQYTDKTIKFIKEKVKKIKENLFKDIANKLKSIKSGEETFKCINQLDKVFYFGAESKSKTYDIYLDSKKFKYSFRHKCIILPKDVFIRGGSVRGKGMSLNEFNSEYIDIFVYNFKNFKEKFLLDDVFDKTSVLKRKVRNYELTKRQGTYYIIDSTNQNENFKKIVDIFKPQKLSELEEIGSVGKAVSIPVEERKFSLRVYDKKDMSFVGMKLSDINTKKKPLIFVRSYLGSPTGVDYFDDMASYLDYKYGVKIACARTQKDEKTIKKNKGSDFVYLREFVDLKSKDFLELDEVMKNEIHSYLDMEVEEKLSLSGMNCGRFLKSLFRVLEEKNVKKIKDKTIRELYAIYKLEKERNKAERSVLFDKNFYRNLFPKEWRALKNKKNKKAKANLDKMKKLEKDFKKNNKTILNLNLRFHSFCIARKSTHKKTLPKYIDLLNCMYEGSK